MTQKLKLVIIIAGTILILAGGVVAYNSLFGAPQQRAELERFIVPLNASQQDTIQELYTQGLIKSERGFSYALKTQEIQPGAYKISKSMNAWALVRELKEPYMKWVVIPEGLRKEQIGEILAKELGWDQKKKSDWITKYTAMNGDYIEGVYFPDTYLISGDEALLQIAQRFINKFNEKFQPYADGFAKANVKWTTALKLASIVQREAAGKDDMPLIAGIFWNRLLMQNMKLETDATIQYVRDNVLHYGEAPQGTQPTHYTSEGSWWTPIKPADKNIESPYNTYRNAGLPPHPISNPGVEAISAVLHPAVTECLYYLHDSSGQIHCAKTYAEHQKNIEQFLK